MFPLHPQSLHSHLFGFFHLFHFLTIFFHFLDNILAVQITFEIIQMNLKSFCLNWFKPIL
jgi:hypothetical protein